MLLTSLLAGQAVGPVLRACNVCANEGPAREGSPFASNRLALLAKRRGYDGRHAVVSRSRDISGPRVGAMGGRRPGRASDVRRLSLSLRHTGNSAVRRICSERWFKSSRRRGMGDVGRNARRRRPPSRASRPGHVHRCGHAGRHDRRDPDSIAPECVRADVAGSGALLRARSALHDLLVQLLVDSVDGAVDLGIGHTELMRDQLHQ